MTTPDDRPSGAPVYPEWRTVTLPDGKRARVTTKVHHGEQLVVVKPIHGRTDDGQ